MNAQLAKALTSVYVIFSFAMCNSSMAGIIAQHLGASDPTVEGWVLTDQSGGEHTFAPVIDDVGASDAWKVDTHAREGDGNYSIPLTAAQRDDVLNNGWSLRANARIIDAGEEGGQRIAFGSYLLDLGKMDNGDPVVTLSYDSEMIGEPFTVTGGAGTFHVYELRDAESSGSVEFLIDGEVATAPGQPAYLEGSAGVLRFGDEYSSPSIGGHVNYASVVLESLSFQELGGDFTRNGVVDEHDLHIWEQYFGSSQVNHGMGDADADGRVTGNDFLIWQRQRSVLTFPEHSFGRWAIDQGYAPGASMPQLVAADDSSIETLDGVRQFDWTKTPTRDLWLNENHISSIEPSHLSLMTGLDGLDLEDNRIASIEGGIFSGLTNLLDLRLSGNQISNIGAETFSGLTNLEELHLSRNQISNIEAGAFLDLMNVEELWLHGNQLQSIEQGDFSGLAKLNDLGLGDNQISDIEPGAFSDLANLSRLFMSSNQLSSIEAGVFEGLMNLRLLHLGGSPIESIEPGAFSGLANLIQLELSSNEIRRIEKDVLSPLTHLEVMYLNDDNISHIETGAFSELGSLRHLDFTRNNLTTLNLEGGDFRSLISFNVQDNSIRSVSLRGAAINQTSLVALVDGGLTSDLRTGIGDVDGITQLDLSNVDFDGVTDLTPLYAMDDVTDLWLVDAFNIDAMDLDVLLNNLATIEGTAIDGVLYMTQSNFDAFNDAGGGLLAAWDAELGHHVEFVLPDNRPVPEPTTFALVLTALVVGCVHGVKRQIR